MKSIVFSHLAWPRTGLQLKGLRFSASGPTYMMPHGVPSAGDWALDRYSAVFMQGTQHTLIDNCGLGEETQGFFLKSFFFGILEEFGWRILQESLLGFLLGFYWDFDGFCIRSYRFRFVIFVGMNFLKSRHGIHQQRFGKMICSMKIVCSKIPC